MMSKEVAETIKDFFNKYPAKQAIKGEILVRPNDDPPGIIYLLNGSVQEYDIAANGEQIVVNVFKPLSFFPMSWAINKTPNQYFFEAASDIKYCLAPAGDVVKFLRSQPDVTFDLLSRVYAGTDGLLRRMAHLMGGNARTRLLYELTVQTRRFGIEQDDGSYLVKLNEQRLAERAGLSRETVNRELSSLKRHVIVDRNGLIVKDLSGLEAELGNEI